MDLLKSGEQAVNEADVWQWTETITQSEKREKRRMVIGSFKKNGSGTK